ncbi:hypothetical protein [Leeia sp.]|uniref:hypothetical protein n=1 Tax=Leeia sp. TaxID=2884678 RepID=UPI0035AF173C
MRITQCWGLLMLGVVTLLSGCQPAPAEITLKEGDARIAITKTRAVTSDEKVDRHQTLLYGTLQISQSTLRHTRANLNCLTATMGNQPDRGGYVDSIASVLANPYPLQRKETTIKVYWVFDGALDAERVLNEAQVALKPGCVLLY